MVARYKNSQFNISMNVDDSVKVALTVKSEKLKARNIDGGGL